MSYQKQNENSVPIMKANFAGTDPQKVKQEIEKDVSQGQGAIRFIVELPLGNE